MKLLQVLAALLLIGGCSNGTATAPSSTSLPPSLATGTGKGQSAPKVQNAPGRASMAPAADDDALLLGNPSQAGKDANNLLVSRPAHTMSYNARNGGPNWVAWHLDKSDIGPARRSTFRPDPLLPPEMQIRPTDYRNSGYDRGHVCPSGDRTRDSELNGQTFVMSNMLPKRPHSTSRFGKTLRNMSAIW